MHPVRAVPGRPATTGVQISSVTAQDFAFVPACGLPALRVPAAVGKTQGRDTTPELTSTGPSTSLLHDMLNAANESTKLVTLQRDGLLQQLDGACRRIDELEARMADTTMQTSQFAAQMQHEANEMMQTASTTNLEMGRKLAHREHEAVALRAELTEARARSADVAA